MVIFDTNAILRYILQDNEEMADAVEEQIRLHSCFVPTEVIAEMVYVLSKVYQIPRAEITVAVMGFLSISGITTTCYDVIKKGLEAYTATNLDFVDCLMTGYQKNGYRVFSFDKALKKYLQY